MTRLGTWLRRRFWSRHGRNWDALYSSPDVRAHYNEVVAWIAHAAPAGGRLLDIGCGTGRHAVPLALGGFDVVGVDFAPGMLARAAGRAAQHRAELDLRQVDVRSGLPFPDGSFDAALCSYVLQTIDNPVALLREVRRVLKPDGALLVEVPTRRPTWADVVTTHEAAFTTPRSRLLLVAKLVGSQIPGATQIYGLDRLQDELNRLGFSITQVRSFPRSLGVLARS
jgi:ubiquinone/menaquinone biosynthesis C-methylase UbiE